MKHPLMTTFVLLSAFLMAQLIGLAVVSTYLDVPSSVAQQTTAWKPLPTVPLTGQPLERPQVEDESTTFIPILIAVLIGTALVLLIIKLRKPIILRVWFFLVVWLTLALAFGAFLPSAVAWLLALLLGAWKIFRPNPYVHNISELFIYGGLAALFVPILNVFAVVALLLLISVYDAIAVWKTKHMVHMAKFQSEAKIFSGLAFPADASDEVRGGGRSRARTSGKKTKKAGAKKTAGRKKKAIMTRVAVLGGGDIGFPLLFAGVVLKGLVLSEPLMAAFLKSLLVSLGAGAGLFALLLAGQKDKFYPAMPFITAGCLLGYAVVSFF